MRYFLISIILVLSSLSSLGIGYHIDVRIKNAKNEKIYLCAYYGSSFIIKDSIKTDQKGKAVFAGPISLEQGLYFIALENKNYFEFLITEAENLTIYTEKNNLIETLDIVGSKESKLYNHYQKELHSLIQTSAQYQMLVKQFKYFPDSSEQYRQKVKEIDLEIIEFKEIMVTEHPNTLTSLLIKASINPKTPDLATQMEKYSESSFRQIFEMNIKNNRLHYFDNIDFTDSRILNSPIYHAKLEHFFNRVIYPHPDSVISELDKVLIKAEKEKKLYRYTLEYLLENYLNCHENGMDKVLVYISKNYYLNGKADWANEKVLNILRERVEILTPSLIGKKAINIELQDENNINASLKQLEGNYTVVFFWDIECETCIKHALALRKIHKSYSASGLKVFAVYTQQDYAKWKSLLNVYQLNWTNVYDEDNIINFGQWYNLATIPTIFLLDENHRIIAKQISPQKLEFFLSKHLKN